ncbi:archaemetzincin family Zn-dependent metalloprotease [Methanoculleus sp. FWC-SCC1]|uniref:Archaemetzincin family Zn-dependent metalloprotease n=1 Tax=Methanoculleus frigidifontis TaxID=2584085 RepID=A0ABT8M8E3_9EURY|nr:archaemetzincin family Zn-dependent metalloprotease [Methanoculleus sp. FWC-SCC1]MDN7024198.1 archaemetzincin family Zn-dependent metalloprotease [Methanoculleus sp. FWC-SCC1]
MGINILWDQQYSPGLSLPVSRLIAMLLERDTELVEYPVLIEGYDRERDQHDAQKILDRLQNTVVRRYGIQEPLLFVTARDLFVQNCDFVFGLARPSAGVAVVSAARLENGYYNRTQSDQDTIDRLAKEGAHEIGHLLGLGHCSDTECIMYRPATLDELDRKKKQFCPACRAALPVSSGQ